MSKRQSTNTRLMDENRRLVESLDETKRIVARALDDIHWALDEARDGSECEAWLTNARDKLRKV
jgi:hypothetical protein